MRFGRLFNAVVGLTLSAGCIGPHSQSSVALPQHFISAPAETVTEGISDTRWWRRFSDPTLDDLVDQAAANNHDVRVAISRVVRARAAAQIATAALLPSADLVGSRERSSTGYPSTIRQQLPDTDVSRAGLQVSWELDLFGRARAARKASLADALAAEDLRRGALLSAISETAVQYFALRGAQDQRRIVADLIGTERETLRLTDLRRSNGSASEFDLDRARADLADTEALLPRLDSQVSASRNRIAMLTGQVPGYWNDLLSRTQAPLVIPAEPAFEPAELLRRRPDVMAADAALKAAGFRQDEARATRFPELLVSALIGSQWTNVNAVDVGSARFSNAIGALTLPIFYGGRIQSGIRVADASQREAMALYEQCLLRALEDVENSMSSYANDTRRAAALQQSIASRTAALSRAQSLHQAGEIDLLQLLDTQRGLLSSRLADSLNETALLTDAVQAYKAFGGGWETFDETSAAISLAGKRPIPGTGP